MEDEQIDYFRDRLLQLQAELDEQNPQATDAAKTVTLDQSAVGRLSRMDALQSQAMAMASQRRKDLLRRRVQIALEKIDSGDYGWCEQCDEAINPRRLEIDPTAGECIQCAEKREQG